MNEAGEKRIRMMVTEVNPFNGSQINDRQDALVRGAAQKHDCIDLSMICDRPCQRRLTFRSGGDSLVE